MSDLTREFTRRVIKTLRTVPARRAGAIARTLGLELATEGVRTASTTEFSLDIAGDVRFDDGLHAHLTAHARADGNSGIARAGLEGVGDALLLDAGLDPDRARRLAETIGEATWTRPDGNTIHIAPGRDGELRVTSFLTMREIWIEGQINLMGGGMPETMRMAYEGAPLRHLLSHPVLDLHDIVVERIDPTSAGCGKILTMIVHVTMAA